MENFTCAVGAFMAITIILLIVILVCNIITIVDVAGDDDDSVSGCWRARSNLARSTDTGRRRAG